MTGVFLDRDGVLVDDVGHLSRVDQLRVIPGAPLAVKRLNDLGIPVVVVTNQSVIGRGFCSEDQMNLIHKALAEQLSKDGAHITRFYYCPHHPTEGVGCYLLDCQCRKPKPGVLRQAAADLGLDLADRVVVGDNFTDIDAGGEVGCRTILVTGLAGEQTKKRPGSSRRQPDLVVDGLGAAVDWILQEVMTS